MSFVSKDIEDVRALVLPDAVVADGSPVGLSGTTLVTWRSSLPDRLFQVYVDGKLAGVTLDPLQRKLVVQIPASFESAVRLQVIAVEPQDTYIDFSEEIDQAPISHAHIRLTLLRSQDLPIGSGVNIYHNDGRRLNALPIPIWPCSCDKAGFGMAQFGLGDCGFDSAAAVGFGKGSFGQGHFGLDADTLQWTSPALPLGQHSLSIAVIDERGNEGPRAETEAITIVPGPRPASDLDVESFDELSGQVVLNLTD